MPELQQDGTAEDKAAPEPPPLDTYRRALRALSMAYSHTMADLAGAVCEADEDGALATGGEFVLTELENRFVHRIRDLQTLIGSLRNHILQGRSSAARVDELRCPADQAADHLNRWLAERPGLELVQVATVPTGEGDVLILPIYYAQG